MPLTYQEFKKEVSQLCGTDLSLYKSQQMDRRIHSLMSLWGIADYDQYLKELKTNAHRYQEFVKKLTINVSEFFRNPDRFMELWEKIVPELLKASRKIKIWTAGCSNGAEPYSIAIILQELQASTQAEIIATDIDQVVLEKAKKGVYLRHEVKSLPPELLKKYFRQEEELFFLGDSIKKKVIFKRHNLLCDPFPQELDLISCRNVVIYFTEEAKNKLYMKFNQSLRMGGYFLAGGTEPLLYYKQVGFENVSPSFYKKFGAPDPHWDPSQRSFT
ncbi:MAG TPA: chemotaxis protein CheR [Firmicutes bacterium]|nr:chemotaxis protein CheR [Bacillota bacterium]